MADPKAYPYAGVGPERAPNYRRVAEGLSDHDLEEELFGKQGEPAYQLALVAEHERRAKRDAP